MTIFLLISATPSSQNDQQWSKWCRIIVQLQREVQVIVGQLWVHLWRADRQHRSSVRLSAHLTCPTTHPPLQCTAHNTDYLAARWTSKFFLQWQKATITNTIIAMPKFNLLRAEAGDVLTNRAMLVSDCSCLLNKMPVVAVHFSHDTGYPSTFIVYNYILVCSVRWLWWLMYTCV